MEIDNRNIKTEFGKEIIFFSTYLKYMPVLLTAAHCVTMKGEQLRAEDFIIYLGRYNLRNMNEQGLQSKDVSTLILSAAVSLQSKDVSTLILSAAVSLQGILKNLSTFCQDIFILLLDITNISFLNIVSLHLNMLCT
jgi:hypothetical protein